MTTTTSTKIWTKEEIRAHIQSGSVAWMTRALMALYARQTTMEQYSGVTTDHNSRGFNGVDAEILTSFAQQHGHGRTLSPKQLVILQKKLIKYCGQLARIANGEL